VQALRAAGSLRELHRIHRGVYAIGHPILSIEGRWMAAVLAYRPGAVLSHRSAGDLWELRRTVGRNIDVTFVRDHGRSHRGITAHRARRLDPTDMTSVRGIPCTTVPRTLLDLADVLDRRRLERAISQAEVLGIFDLKELEELLGRSPGRRLRKVRRILDEYEQGTNLTRPSSRSGSLHCASVLICRVHGSMNGSCSMEGR
jgi:predicted transcriptional regulator of viral defense system